VRKGHMRAVYSPVSGTYQYRQFVDSARPQSSTLIGLARRDRPQSITRARWIGPGLYLICQRLQNVAN
jgi:hypothetical protein